jgi:hypothetical protein
MPPRGDSCNLLSWQHRPPVSYPLSSGAPSEKFLLFKKVEYIQKGVPDKRIITCRPTPFLITRIDSRGTDEYVSYKNNRL